MSLTRWPRLVMAIHSLSSALSSVARALSQPQPCGPDAAVSPPQKPPRPPIPGPPGPPSSPTALTLSSIGVSGRSKTSFLVLWVGGNRWLSWAALSLNIWAPFTGHNLESFAGSCVGEERAKRTAGGWQGAHNVCPYSICQKWSIRLQGRLGNAVKHRYLVEYHWFQPQPSLRIVARTKEQHVFSTYKYYFYSILPSGFCFCFKRTMQMKESSWF